jgi:hypothetical protein
MKTDSVIRCYPNLIAVAFCVAGALLGGAAQAGTVFTDEATFIAATGAVSLPLPSSDSGESP